MPDTKITLYTGAQTISNTNTPVAGPAGPNGWSPVFQLVSDGTLREVLQIVDWTGGTSTKPSVVNQFIGDTGIVSTASLAKNVKGNIGLTGATGAPGANGLTGATGAPGANGTTDATAIKYKGLWSSATSYIVNDTVSYTTAGSTSLWLCLNPNTNSPINLANANWLRLATGVSNSTRFKGVWLSTNTYTSGDYAVYNGFYWIAQDSTLGSLDVPGVSNGWTQAGSYLPIVNTANNGQVLTVVGGQWASAALPGASNLQKFYATIATPYTTNTPSTNYTEFPVQWETPIINTTAANWSVANREYTVSVAGMYAVAINLGVYNAHSSGYSFDHIIILKKGADTRLIFNTANGFPFIASGVAYSYDHYFSTYLNVGDRVKSSLYGNTQLVPIRIGSVTAGANLTAYNCFSILQLS